MEKIQNYIKSNRHIWHLIYWPIHILWYELVRLVSADADVLIVRSDWDREIPFIEWFVFPYVLWYVYIGAVLIYSLTRGRKEFLRCSALVCTCMFLPMLFCTIVPNGIDASIRPDFETLGRTNLATKLVELIYFADSPPRCVMPSMHCSVSVGLFFTLFRSEGLKGRPWIKLCGGILSLLIILSTVFIKQHSILDLIAGVALGIIVFAVVTVIEKIRNK